MFEETLCQPVDSLSRSHLRCPLEQPDLIYARVMRVGNSRVKKEGLTKVSVIPSISR